MLPYICGMKLKFGPATALYKVGNRILNYFAHATDVCVIYRSSHVTRLMASICKEETYTASSNFLPQEVEKGGRQFAYVQIIQTSSLSV